MQGPDTDVNAKDYYDGAMELLKKYIDGGALVVKSGKTSYDQVKADSWDVEDEKKAMKDRYWFPYHPDITLFHEDVPDY